MRKLLLITIITLAFANTASAKTFKDIPESYAGYASIEWAVEKKIIQGFSDQTYRKSDKLTESQFAAVVARYFNPLVDSRPKGSHWSDTYYNYLKEVGLILPGHSDAQKKFEPISRGELASMLAKSQDPTIKNNKAAVEWLYENKITKGFGKSPDAFVDFNPTGILERGQVASFFQRMDSNGFTVVKKGENARVELIKRIELQKLLRPSWESQNLIIQDYENLSGSTIRDQEYLIRVDFYLSDSAININLFGTDELSMNLVAEALAKSFKTSDEAVYIEKLKTAFSNGDHTVKLNDKVISIDRRTTGIGTKVISLLYKY